MSTHSIVPSTPVHIQYLPNVAHVMCAHIYCIVCIFFPRPVCILNLQTEEGTVTDVNPHLSSCCELLELILRKGLQREYYNKAKPCRQEYRTLEPAYILTSVCLPQSQSLV